MRVWLPATGRLFLGAAHCQGQDCLSVQVSAIKCKLQKYGSLRIERENNVGLTVRVTTRHHSSKKNLTARASRRGLWGAGWCPLPEHPAPGREYPGSGRKGGGTGHSCVSAEAQGARIGGFGCRGLLTLVLVWRTQGHAPLRPGKSVFTAPRAHTQLGSFIGWGGGFGGFGFWLFFFSFSITSD